MEGKSKNHNYFSISLIPRIIVDVPLLGATMFLRGEKQAEPLISPGLLLFGWFLDVNRTPCRGI